MRSTQFEWLISDELPSLLKSMRLHDAANDMVKLIAAKNATHDEMLDLLGEVSDQCHMLASVVADQDVAERADWLGSMAHHIMCSEAATTPQAVANHASRAMHIAANKLGVTFIGERCDA